MGGTCSGSSGAQEDCDLDLYVQRHHLPKHISTNRHNYEVSGQILDPALTTLKPK